MSGFLDDSRLFVQDLTDHNKNPNGRVRILIKDRSIASNASGDLEVLCTLGNDFKLSGGASWDTPIDNFIQNFTGKNSDSGGMLGLLSKGASLAQNALQLTTGTSIKTLAQTAVFWMGGRNVDYVFPFNLLAIKPDQDIREDILKLMRCVTPSLGGNVINTLSGLASNSNFGFLEGITDSVSGFLSGGSDISNALNKITDSTLMTVPLGYTPVNNIVNTTTGNSVDGTIDITAGNWLRLRNMVATDVQFDISKVATSYGYPLYARCSISVKPSRMLVMSDIEDMISGGTMAGKFSSMVSRGMDNVISGVGEGTIL